MTMTSLEASRRAMLVILVLVSNPMGCTSAARPVTIGINPWPGYELLYLAGEKGFFQKHGLRIDLKEYSSLGDVRRAYEQGQIDGMACTMVEVLQAREQPERRPEVVMALDYSAGADVILARPGITNVRQLKGRRVAAELASLGIYMTSRALALEGVSLRDVQLEPVDQAEMESAARLGSLDAVVTYPPMSVQIEKLGWRRVFDSGRIPGEVVDVLAIDARALNRVGGFQRGLFGAMSEATRFLGTNRPEAIALMAGREHLTPAEFEQALSQIQLIPVAEMPRYLAPGGPIEVVFASLCRMLQSSGQLPGNRGVDGLVVAPPAAVGDR